METLMFPLYGRARCSKLYPDIFPDKEAEALINRIDYDFGYIESLDMKTIEYNRNWVCSFRVTHLLA